MRKIAWMITLLFAMFVVWEGVAFSNQIYIPVVYNTAPTPTSAPTPYPSTVQILPNSSHFIDRDGYLHVNGEVFNNTSDHLRDVKITVNFYNDSHQLVGTDYAYIYLIYLPAFEKACFDFYLPNPPDWTTYEFEAPTYSTDGEPLPNLVIFNDYGFYDSTWGWYGIIGNVRNDEESRVTMVSPVGTLYNHTGTVLGCYFTYVVGNDIDPGLIRPFEIYFSDRDYADVDSYRLQVDGFVQPP